ncbi:hypothetical protein PybrP1_002670 [[Pythium] brassicae (nom. inval.)]|nr:hypothetical protein PybrP1_002670 [[Pythium] brassicae (nom. inval.)]
MAPASKQGRAFAALFPPLLQAQHDNSSSSTDAVDISTDDLALPPLEQAVDAALYRALQRWNALEPAALEAALPYAQRLRRSRAVARWALYESGELSSGDESDEHQSGSRKRRRRERSRRRRQDQLLEVFAALPTADVLRAAREPSARLREFAATFTAKTRALQQKRSMGDTKTHMCFEFARPAPALEDAAAVAAAARAGGGDEGGDDTEQQRAQQQQQDTEAAQARSTTQRNNLLLARGIDMATSEKPADDKEELVLWLDVLHPSKDPAKTQSFLVRESQTLADVVDLVVCAFDQRLGDHARHSKLVYFGGAFYADRRSPESLDYADEIRTWVAASPARRATYGGATGSGASLAMETAAFRDLPLQIDVPGVYIHQGECEHLLRIRDARLPHDLDAPSRGGAFPLRLPNPLARALRSCFVCQQYSAKYICYGDRLGIADPMFFCERCYRVAHFDRDGALVYRDFQSFPYIQD